MPRHYYRLTEASAILGVSVDSLRAYELKGVVSYTRIGGQRMLTERDFKAIRGYRSQFGRKRQQAASDVVAPRQ
jgi:DNA-binding transcriptional MerR regulator